MEVRTAPNLLGQAPESVLARAKSQPPFARSEQLQPETRRAGCGLPCAKCGTYYAADLNICPVCKTSERISAHAASAVAPVHPAEELPSTEALEEERERFLRDFKAHVYQAHMQIQAGSSLLCSQEANHPEGAGAAEICKQCFDDVVNRADRLEAAIHIDLQEATRIVYEAVWADTSDATKTYRNAAAALLQELRHRAGISEVMAAAAQSYSH